MSGRRRIFTQVLKYGVMGLTAILVVSAIYTAMLISERQTALRDVSRYNATWLVAQAALEVSRLTAVLAAFDGLGVEGGVDHVVEGGVDEVQLRLDIVANRVRILTEGDQGAFIRSKAELNATLAELENAVNFSTPIIDRLQPNGSTAEVYSVFFPLLSKLNRLAASVHERGAELVTADLQNLGKLNRIFSGLLIGLILCGFCLIAFARLSYKMLEAAHYQVHSLVSNLHVQNTRFDAALNNMSQGLCMGTGNFKLVVCNDRFRELFGLRQAVAPGTSIHDLYEAMAEHGKVSPEFVQRLIVKHTNLIAAGTSARVLHEEQGRSLALMHEPMQDGGWVTTYEDITEQRKAEARVTFMADHDILTGLPNRLRFRDRLSQAIPNLRNSLTQLAVICLDLDGFKQINDSLGHPAGDSLLRMVAARLRNCTSERDVVARMGGDEFVVFCTTSNRPLATDAIAKRIIDTLGAPYDLDGQRVTISASIGIAQTTDPTEDPDLLLKNADIALYKAKAGGRAAYRFFELTMETELRQRRLIERDLGSALENGEFELLFQPSFGLRTRNLAGFEALLRWNHPTRGLILPDEFIPISEDTGLILQIGAWVLHQACAEAVRWPEPKRVAVNLSAIQFETDLVGAVTDALKKSGLPPELLELEITETTLIKDNDRVLLMMQRLKELGVRTALDDFGTGYSALSYLRMFPFDKIKIDRAFVKDISEREDSRAIVASIIQLAATLGMTTTVEGVERACQVAALIETGCDEVQGFFFGHPEPARQLHHWFGQNLELVDQGLLT